MLIVAHSALAISHATGWIRECREKVAGDHDLDVGLTPRDWARLSWRRVRLRAVWDLLWRKGLPVHAAQLWFAPPVRVDTMRVRGRTLPAKTYLDGWGWEQCPIDVWVQHSDGAHVVEWYRTSKTNVWARRHWRKVHWRGVPLYVPTEASEVAEERFGPGWKTPSLEKWYGAQQAKARTDSVYNDCGDAVVRPGSAVLRGVTNLLSGQPRFVNGGPKAMIEGYDLDVALSTLAVLCWAAAGGALCRGCCGPCYAHGRGSAGRCCASGTTR